MANSTDPDVLACRAALLLYSMFLTPLSSSAVNDCRSNVYHYNCIFAAKKWGGGTFCCEPVVYVYKERGFERTVRRCFVAMAKGEQSDTLM